MDLDRSRDSDNVSPGQADEGPLVEGGGPQLTGLPGEGIQLLRH